MHRLRVPAGRFGDGHRHVLQFPGLDAVDAMHFVGGADRAGVVTTHDQQAFVHRVMRRAVRLRRSLQLEQMLERDTDQQLSTHVGHAQHGAASAMGQGVNRALGSDFLHHRHRQAEPLRGDAEDDDRLGARLLDRLGRREVSRALGDVSGRDWAIEQRLRRPRIHGAVAAVHVLRELGARAVTSNADGVPAALAHDADPWPGRALGAGSQQLRFSSVVLRVHQQRQMHERLVMARVEVQRFAIGGGSIGLVTDGIAHETKKIEHLD